jgi:hypothetical protein
MKNISIKPGDNIWVQDEMDDQMLLIRYLYDGTLMVEDHRDGEVVFKTPKELLDEARASLKRANLI